MVLTNPYHDLFRLLQEQSPDLTLAARKKLIWAYSWAIPDKEAIETLAGLGPLLELGAGTGYWAWLLRQSRVDIVALDRDPDQPPHWTVVERGDESSVSTYPDRTLLVCWPPYQDPMAARALKHFRKVAYVGEMGGRTADEEFHRELKERFSLTHEQGIPNWPGFSDRLMVFERIR